MFFKEYYSKNQAIDKAVELSNKPLLITEDGETFREYVEYGVYTEINDLGKRVYGVTESSNLLFKSCFQFSTHLYNVYKGEID